MHAVALHINRDRHGKSSPAATEDGLSLLPRRFAWLVLGAGTVRGALTDCYYDAAAATRGGAVLGASMAS